jgi:hypothetical protein
MLNTSKKKTLLLKLIKVTILIKNKVMTQEQKDLLLKDICARLPYKVKASFYDKEEECETWDQIDGIIIDGCVDIGLYSLSIECIKLYLFPLSSMTEEQKEEYCQLQQKIIYNSKGVVNEDITEYINWCYKKHLDINGLIPKGLAIDATGLNIY